MEGGGSQWPKKTIQGKASSTYRAAQKQPNSGCQPPREGGKEGWSEKNQRGQTIWRTPRSQPSTHRALSYERDKRRPLKQGLIREVKVGQLRLIYFNAYSLKNKLDDLNIVADL